MVNLLYLVLFYPLIFQKVYSDFELQGIDQELLASDTYEAIIRRLQLEETNSALNDNSVSGSSSHHGTSNNLLNLGSISNASQAVSNMGSMVEGAGAKVFSLFK